ncbi:MAG: hypothetical protein LUD16_05510 [Lachnospiraceae bacterium]|nr:hypothetical protein [Lachnospiraceae bacterium]
MSKQEIPPAVAAKTEEIAKLVHTSWMQEKISHGWTYGEAHQVEERKHPSICSYDELSEEEKDMDRATVRCVLQALADMGFRIEEEK